MELVREDEHLIAWTDQRRGRYRLKCSCAAPVFKGSDIFEAFRKYEQHLIAKHQQQELGL
jgi:hypothetical protein